MVYYDPMNQKTIIKTGSFLLLFTLLFILSSCSSTAGDVRITKDELQNTLWLSPVCGMPAEGHYGREGYFLGKDGTLLFINIFSMTGDTWELEGDNLLLYSHTERYPEPWPVSYPLTRRNGTAAISPVEDSLEMLPPSAQKITAEIPVGRWMVSTMLNPDNATSDPENPAYIKITEENNTVSIYGNGGVNNFRGNLTLEEFKWKGGPIMSTLMAGPDLEYEDLFMKNLERISRFLMIDNYLFLYEESELVLILKNAED